MLPTSHAFHSRLVEPMLDEFEKRAATVTFSPAKIPVISNRDGKPAGDEIATPAYWRHHAREPVQFMAGIKHLERQGHLLFVELGPHPALLSQARETWTGVDAKWLPSCRRNWSDWGCLLASVAELHLLGCSIDWQGFDRDYQRRRVRLPTYPFQRRQCWLEVPARQVAAEGRSQSELLRAATTTGHRLLGRRIRSAVTLYESELSVDSPVWLKDHRVLETVVTPAAATLEMVLAAATMHFKTSAVTVEDVAIHKVLVLPSEGRCTVQLILEPHDSETAAFRILASRNRAAGRSGTFIWPAMCRQVACRHWVLRRTDVAYNNLSALYQDEFGISSAEIGCRTLDRLFSRWSGCIAARTRRLPRSSFRNI